MLVVCANDGEAFAFDDPLEVLRAETIGDVAGALAAADRAVQNGAYVAGFITYESGSAFVPRQAEPSVGALPFVLIGVYRSPCPAPQASGEPISVGPLSPAISRLQYEARVENVLERIRNGDVYQVNLATAFAFAFRGEPYAFYDALCGDGAFPYAAYVETPERAIVSCSPELFVRFEDGAVRTKPMKGTSAPDDTGALANAKNRAEHVMIVDLLRNDMNRLGARVTVERLAEIERYPTFATMTSTIAARRSSPFTLEDTFGAMFPCGSITGAPKVTAMNAIAQLESARGIFCGSIGFRGPGGRGTWNVAIRTATIDRASGRGTLHVGGGIVADSKPRDEWAEILIKRRFLDRLAPTYALLETMRRDDDGGYHELDEHLARLRTSADELHFDFDETSILRALAAVIPGDLLVRVELARDGTFDITHRDFYDETEAVAVWASQIVDPSEPLQRHKTTWRPHYDAASRAARACNAFDAVLRTREGYLADGARTNVFVDLDGDGVLATPPSTDGALPGILRGRLIAQGRAIERRLTEFDVTHAASVYLGNSARGLRRVRFA